MFRTLNEQYRLEIIHIHENKWRNIKMSYWKVLPGALEDHEILKTWYDMAYEAAYNQDEKRQCKQK